MFNYETRFRYRNIKTDKYEDLPFREAFYRLIQEAMINYLTNPIGFIFPFLKQYRVLNPYKALNENVDTLFTILKGFCESSKDSSSIYNRAIKLDMFTLDEVFRDSICFLLAGMDTTASGIAATLYYLKKRPDVMKKLKEELIKSDMGYLSKENLFQEPIGDADSSAPGLVHPVPNDHLKNLYKHIQNCDYITYVFKEVCRLDSPGMFSIRYEALEDIKICGVPIPKGTILDMNAYGPHLDKEQWKQPLDFIPERFDPMSDMFNKPSSNGTTGKSRHPKSMVPFSSGIRICPGQALATLETKIVVSRIINRIEYEIDAKQLANPNACFNVTSQLHVKGKILK